MNVYCSYTEELRKRKRVLPNIWEMNLNPLKIPFILAAIGWDAPPQQALKHRKKYIGGRRNKITFREVDAEVLKLFAISRGETKCCHPYIEEHASKLRRCNARDTSMDLLMSSLECKMQRFSTENFPTNNKSITTHPLPSIAAIKPCNKDPGFNLLHIYKTSQLN